MMFQKFVSASFLALALVSLAASGEFIAIVTRLEDGKIAFKKFEEDSWTVRDARMKGTEQMLPAADNVKVFQAKIVKTAARKLERGTLELPGGLRNEYLRKNIDERPDFAVPLVLHARIITDDNGKSIREIHAVLPPVGTPCAILKVQGGKVTFINRFTAPNTEVTLPVAADVKVFYANSGKLIVSSEVPGGLDNEKLKDFDAAKNIGTFIPAEIITDAGGKQIKELWVVQSASPKKQP